MTKYRMPAEWEPQAATWLSWPHNVETWPENLDAAQREFVQFANAIAESQPVFIMASPAQWKAAKQQLGTRPNLNFVPIETNDAWARDYGPTFVKDDANDGLFALDWKYNAWGGKYPPYDLDQRAASQVADFLGVESVPVDFCFEGGAIEINSRRVLLSTTTCAFHPGRNPNASHAVVDQLFQDLLGASEVIWLDEESIEGDDTDGHIDQLFRFVNDETIVFAGSDGSQKNTLAVRENCEELVRQFAEKSVSAVELIELPSPSPISFCGRRIPASYCNFLICNEVVIVPQFGRDEDEIAIEKLDELFADREVLGLPSLNLSVGLGSFHCLSQQQPI